jgi:DNA topoisomerase I
VSSAVHRDSGIVSGSSPGAEPLVGPEAARDAGLRYVCDDEPGFTRRRAGRGFTYRGEDGAVVEDAEARARIEALVIPPAWRDVWICRDERGHLQATGRDEAGRKQYLYHPRWREVRDRAKFDGLVAFGEALPALRRRVRRDVRRPELSARQVVAAVVRLMDATLVRVGNVSYARSNGSYGLTTLRTRHVRVAGDEIDLRFVGKGGQRHELSVRDEEVARVVRACQEIPGYEVFQYVDESGVRRRIDSADVNAYLRETTGRDVTAKDFRTWGATVLSARGLHRLGPDVPLSERARSRTLLAVVREVAGVLGNTPTVCRRSYVHPNVIEGYLDGSFPERYGRALARAKSSAPRELRRHEAATWRYLAEG